MVDKVDSITVSIIIPVYNAEDTVQIALECIAKQSYTQLELIFINDCSSDNSLSVLQNYRPILEEKGMQICIISHEVNKGVAAARNTGLNHATGEYIYYVDADDAIEPDTIALLVEKALERNADIVGCNWFLTFAQNERKMNQPSFVESAQAIENILNGSMRWNLWLFMVRRSVYEHNHIQFILGQNMGEDLMVMIKLFAYADKVAYVDKALYHYGQSNTQSLTNTYSKKHIEEVTANVKEVEDFLSDRLDKQKLDVLISYLKLNIKLPLLVSNNKHNYSFWNSWFGEANQYVLDNKSTSLRIRVLQWVASKKMYFLVRCHYYLVVRFVYGVIYR